MTPKIRNSLAALFILAFPFMVALGFLIAQVMRPLPPLPPFPNPNGYDDLVKAGEILGSAQTDYGKMNREELQMFVAGNSYSLQLARSGLEQKCRVPLKFSPIDPDLDNRLSSLKKLAQTFVAEGRLAELENRPGAAAKSYLDAVHAGNESVRGGVLIDQMVGTAMEVIGTSHLQTLIDQLDAKSCRETAATLETLDAQKQTWSDVLQQEHDWSRRAFPGLRNEFARVMTRNSMKIVFQKTGQKFNAQQTKTRQLMIDLAARAYELDKGHRPGSLADLVPDYLKAVPQDPLTGTNIVYTP